MCAVSCEFSNGYLKHMCLKEIELCVQNLLTIIGSTTNKYFVWGAG